MTKRIDDITGIPSNEYLDAQIEAEDQELLRQAQHVNEMARTEGWKFLEKCLLAQLDGVKEQLIDEREYRSILRLQASAASISNLIGTVRHYCQVVVDATEATKPQPR